MASSGQMRSVSIVGVGYAGLTTAVGFGLGGYAIWAIDTDKEKVASINRRVSPVVEKDLNESLRMINIQASDRYEDILKTQVTFVCVGTPSQPDGSINTEYLGEASSSIARVLEKKAESHLVVIRSTVIPGTTEKLVSPLIPPRHGLTYNPEFLQQGEALVGFSRPDRIVIGEREHRDGVALEELYRTFYHSTSTFVHTSLRAAEMIKYGSNTYLATKISFINELGNICKLLGIDTYEVARGMGFDKRIGDRFLNAGTGFGGSCFTKDTAALIAQAKDLGYDAQILRDVLEVNERQPLRMLQLLKKHLDPKGKTIGVLGLAFKPGTDDVRDTRAANVIEALLKEGARVRAYDPAAVSNFRPLFPEIDYVSLDQTLQSDAILIMTEWPEFQSIDYRGKIVIDGRNVFKAREARIYEGICW